MVWGCVGRGWAWGSYGGGKGFSSAHFLFFLLAFMITAHHRKHGKVLILKGTEPSPHKQLSNEFHCVAQLASYWGALWSDLEQVLQHSPRFCPNKFHQPVGASPVAILSSRLFCLLASGYDTSADFTTQELKPQTLHWAPSNSALENRSFPKCVPSLGALSCVFYLLFGGVLPEFLVYNSVLFPCSNSCMSPVS